MNIKEDITVVIPCYNTKAEFLREAIDSVESYKGKYNYTIIIVDDGSTSEATILFLKNLSNKGKVNVIWQKNAGPASARNTGVKNAGSDYVLFLDSDNKIYPVYIDKGIAALEQDSNGAVVYGNPVFFGDITEPRFKPGPFDVKRILLENFIDTCSVVRKKAWEDIGGMDESKLLIGHEDWEFWIHLYNAGWKLIYVNEIMYEYRIRKESVITQVSDNNYKKLIEYIYKKHWHLVYKTYYSLYAKAIIYDNDRKRPFRSFIKYIKDKICIQRHE